MTEQYAIDVIRNALTVALELAGPMLAASLAVGMLVSIFQAVTQINETTLSFVPKIAAVAGVSAVLGPWMGATVVTFTVQIFTSLGTAAH